MNPSPPPKRSFIETLGDLSSRVAGRFVPDPFVIAITLTIVTFLAAFACGDTLSSSPPTQRLETLITQGWFAGLFGKNGLTFAFQMVLVLVTGFAFANSPPIQRAINALSRLPRSSAQASALVALAASISGTIHWGLGAVAGAMLAREIGRSWNEQGRTLHYPLLGAAAYSGLLVWHGGLSGSAPLTVANQGHFLAQRIGTIPVDQTLFSTLNLITTPALILATVALYFALSPSKEHSLGYSHFIHNPTPPTDITTNTQQHPNDDPRHPALRALEEGFHIPVISALFCASFLTLSFINDGFKAFNLNTLNLIFLSLGLLFHGSTRSYVQAAAEGARGSVGILLQFPLYFGIMGILKSSGLIQQISDGFVAMATTDTLPLFTYLSAGLVNLFVPSGGGQWAVQGPVMMDAAQTLQTPNAKVIMAVAYGDAWTNMLQPFWALPLLGIMGLRARDIIGYTTLLFLIAAPITMLALWLL